MWSLIDYVVIEILNYRHKYITAYIIRYMLYMIYQKVYLFYFISVYFSFIYWWFRATYVWIHLCFLYPWGRTAFLMKVVKTLNKRKINHVNFVLFLSSNVYIISSVCVYILLFFKIRKIIWKKRNMKQNIFFLGRTKPVLIIR